MDNDLSLNRILSVMIKKMGCFLKDPRETLAHQPI